MKKIFLISIFLLNLILVKPTDSAMTGGNYSIPVDSFTISEQGNFSGGDYLMYDSSGNFASGLEQGGDFILHGGFLHSSSGTISGILSQDTINFGTASLDSVSLGSVGITVYTTSDSGYTLSIAEDGNLRSAGIGDINDVADGSVTAGQEEYGISTVGGDGLLATDTAINGNVNVASRNSEAINVLNTIQFKMSVSRSSLAGIYSQIVTFTTSINP